MMASLNMKGPVDLNESSVSRNVAANKVGNYALGKTGTGEKADVFSVSYIGRSDNDVAKRLKDHVGEYSKFKFSYAGSPVAACREECRNFHDFQPPGNTLHPAAPGGSNAACPWC